jgi:integrase
MAILAECPICKRRQRASNKVCKCGEKLDTAKRSNRVRYWITYRLPGGMQRKELVGFSIEEARAADGKRKGQKREGRIFEMLPDSKVTFKELETWYMGKAEVKALASFQRIKAAFKVFNKTFGRCVAGGLLPQDLEEYRAARLHSGIKASTIDVELNIVRGMVSKAFDNEKVGERTLRAFRRVKNLTKRSENARRRTVTLAEYLQLLAAAPRHFTGMLIMAMNTGMRPGELRRLTWAHIDRKAGMIRLPKDFTKENKEKVIPINHHVQAVLDGLVRHINHDRVFCYGGLPICGPRGSYGALKGACKRAGITYGRKTEGGLTMHDFRRSVKTYMVSAGVDKVYRDLILGHALQGMDRVYINPAEDTIRQAMDRYTAWLDAELANVAKTLPSGIMLKAN